jgi:hypothetical protein
MNGGKGRGKKKMSVHRFDYPTAAAPTASLVFTRGARLVADTPSLRLNQEVDRAKGGTPMARNYGPVVRIYPFTAILTLASESEADFEDMVTWIEDVAEGAVNTFEWTDENSVVHTVRIMNTGEIPFPKFGWDSVSCTLQLEVEP